MNATWRIMLIAGLAMVSPLVAQDQAEKAPEPTSESNRKDGRWACHLNGGSYLVALNRIVSISRHRYVLDGSVVVDELVVDTSGQSLVRFYHITPVTDEMRGTGFTQSASRLLDRSKELLEQGAERAGTGLHEMVQKSYPHTTHAKQVEFRLSSAEALGAIQASVTAAWEIGRGRTCRVH